MVAVAPLYLIEWLEYLLTLFGSHANAVVVHGEQQIAAVDGGLNLYHTVGIGEFY